MNPTLGRNIAEFLVDVNVAEHVERVGSRLAHLVDKLIELGGLERPAESDVGVRLEEPEVGLVGIGFDQLLAEGGYRPSAGFFYWPAPLSLLQKTRGIRT